MKILEIREEMNPKYQWDLTGMYSSDKIWEISYEKIFRELDTFSQYQGKIESSEKLLLELMKLVENLNKEVLKLYVYANMKFRQDMQNSLYQGLKSKADTIYTKLRTSVSFIDPEILAMGEEKIKSFLKKNQELQIYKHDFDNIFRKAKHTLPKEQEELFAKLSEISNIPLNIFNIVSNVETKFDLTKDKQGKEFEVTHGSYSRLMESNDRTLRENTYDSYYNYFTSRNETIAGLYSGFIKKEAFFSKERNYNSSLEASLSENNIPTEVYDTLVKSVNNRLDLVHRYTRMRKKILNLDVVKPYDLSVPIVDNIEYTIEYEEAKSVILKSLAPMGEEYVSIVRTILNSNWIDVYENKNKMSGAFSWGTYGTPPYIMMNYVDNLNSLFTLTHELGHSVHSHYTRTTQPFVYGHYTIFLAEIASTTHEALLMDYLLKTTEDKAMKKYLLSYYLSNFNGIFFRQTMFAEFEREAHKLEENKMKINAESLNSIYKTLLEKYFGSDFGVDNKIICEWARIPHFYRNFYVYQYATGYASAIAISKAILEGKEGAVEDFVEMLKSGSSNYSIPLLQKAGVDMTASKPIEDTLDVFEELLNQFESE
jgi:oligoendopeptidase F